jgi:hypothetical protein
VSSQKSEKAASVTVFGFAHCFGGGGELVSFGCQNLNKVNRAKDPPHRRIWFY